ncbi:hypothetical protein GT755_00425 [Herbidospora sp. NEAU-GS84]|uniref:Lipoprotein n=1 Tax=Herbidospora solisilvae TaxID=2696284 RepID=A0A7C9JB05_9ACTN|nr:hypothetical protein [Herbidospora solisilvae]NAS20143.1 hypothetical protein [Herbidospora solisilvae]
MRRIFVLLVTAALLLGTSGCTVPTNGITGITLDAEGNLVVAFAWCGRAPDGAIVHHDRTSIGSASPAPPEDPSTVGPSIVDAVYTAPDLQAEVTSFRLDAPDNGWRLERKLQDFDPAISYSVYGGTDDNSFSTVTVSFELGDVEELKRRPGTVLVQSWDERANEVVDTFIPQSDFDRDGNDDCP